MNKKIGVSMVVTTNESRRIAAEEMRKDIPSLNSFNEPKEFIIKKWLTEWILKSISEKRIKSNDILPSKHELSKLLGVSTGTVQNAIRYIEDSGLLKSKQKVGTLISAGDKSVNILKFTSKRDKAVLAIKQILIRKNFNIGDAIPSTRKAAAFMGFSQNTVRLAYECLKNEGVIEYKKMPGRESDFVLKSLPVISPDELEKIENLFPETLVEKITKSIKNFLAAKYKVGDRIPSHEEFAKSLNVSVKTIHDCIKILNKEGIVISRRGKYGSILAQNPLQPVWEPLKENSIFADASESAFYSYQKTYDKIIKLINDKYAPGDKLPSMKDLSEMFDVSTNTVRKALINISQNGYITFSRGRYGGTYVMDKPSAVDEQPYKWLAVNPNYI